MIEKYNDFYVLNYIEEKFHSAEYGTSYQNEKWYKCEDVDPVIAMLKETLGVYADEGYYEESIDNNVIMGDASYTPILRDNGETAREVLKKLEENFNSE